MMPTISKIAKLCLLCTTDMWAVIGFKQTSHEMEDICSEIGPRMMV